MQHIGEIADRAGIEQASGPLGQFVQDHLEAQVAGVKVRGHVLQLLPDALLPIACVLLLPGPALHALAARGLGHEQVGHGLDLVAEVLLVGQVLVLLGLEETLQPIQGLQGLGPALVAQGAEPLQDYVLLQLGQLLERCRPVRVEVSGQVPPLCIGQVQDRLHLLGDSVPPHGDDLADGGHDLEGVRGEPITLELLVHHLGLDRADQPHDLLDRLLGLDLVIGPVDQLEALEQDLLPSGWGTLA